MEPEGGLHAALPPTTGSSCRMPAPGEEPRVGVGDTAEAGRESRPTRTMEPVRVVPDVPAEEAGRALLRPHPDEA
ncbi:MAG TPA: hypothetical protein VGV91_03095 [Rubrobacter sp.]|nr:hypothetical protein [Rubrobacter sp.]